MRIFTFYIEGEQNGTEVAAGFVRAKDAKAALALLRSPDSVVFSLPADVEWPGLPNEVVWIESGSLRRRG